MKRTKPAVNGEFNKDPPDIYHDAPQRDNLPEEIRLLILLQHVLQAADDLLAAHGDACGCSLCHDTRGMLYNVEISEGAVDCNLRRPFEEAAVPCPICHPLEDEEKEEAAPAAVPEPAVPAAPAAQAESQGFLVRFRGRKIHFSFGTAGAAEGDK